ncbi:hypothetical protein NA56DRAFT_743519 [Hyaloscypha hepaticicola]|uniref:Uncharacterized protein n=1 Tax=Hyaloscypha hepaticicola TaxID=2082293 RepID=A0A2J6QLQ9_9HELO|nr:hypothetical protein NA56DRAFT_743519 [Hyaloscypha hepaticicola]
MERVSRKRPLSEVENTNSGPANKRQEIEPKSPKTAIRDASEALIEVIRKAEDIHSCPTKSNPKSSSVTVSNGNKKQDVSADAAAGFEFEKDNPTGLTSIPACRKTLYGGKFNGYIDFNPVAAMASKFMQDRLSDRYLGSKRVTILMGNGPSTCTPQ